MLLVFVGSLVILTVLVEASLSLRCLMKKQLSTKE
jgi:hypothetical protein